ncbi:heparan-alpha-glucosaminide N-acetyltransferase domain-containing protein [Streptomyces sp. KL116D]|uniref:heparan-alpha-glucosaminide N-acetyltransferase domain-containing protein n=1 Tax=Streptomyces sp. KL116D TaxID=3045152 RepID=UPI003557207C
MTRQASWNVSTAPAPPPPVPPVPPRTASAGRLVGIDLARGLAVLGMYAAHVGPDPTIGGPLGSVLEVARGRSAALFAVLAGFSLVLITGRPRPRTGRAGRQARARIVIRAVVLMAVGYALTALDTDVDVILSFYGLLFLLVLPLRRLGVRALALLAAAAALVLPQVLYLIRQSIEGGSWADAVVAHDPLARLTDTDGVLELFFTGEYPVLTWLPFMLAGMALGRLDLGSARTRARLLGCGGALAVVGYGGSWLALHSVPGALPTIDAATDGGSASTAWWSDTVGYVIDRTPADWLLVAVPHSQTTFSVLGNTGVALLVVAACLTVTSRMPRLTRLATPVTAVGMTALSAYVLHILAIRVVGMPDATGPALLALLLFAGTAMAVATAWTRVLRRGPCEYLLHACTLPARRVR